MHMSICTITQTPVACRVRQSTAAVRPTRCFKCAHKGHDKKCENFNPTTKEKHPFSLTKTVDSEKNIALISLKVSYYFRRGGECDRECESESESERLEL